MVHLTLRPSSFVPHPSSLILHPSSLILHPSSLILHPSPPMPTSTSSVLPAHGIAWYLAGICLVASLGGLLFGFDTAVISGTVESVKEQYGLNEFQEGWFGSSALVGCILGTAVAGGLSDRLGRKPVLLISAVLFLVSARPCAAAAPDFPWLIAGRILAGLGVGVASVVAPMYISEFSPPRLRGRLVAFYQLSIVLGILAAYLSNWLLARFAAANPAAFAQIGWLQQAVIAEVWRAMFAVGAVPAAVFLLLLLPVPESPRWLVKAGREAAAVPATGQDRRRETAQREILEIRLAANEESGARSASFSSRASAWPCWWAWDCRSSVRCRA